MKTSWTSRLYDYRVRIVDDRSNGNPLKDYDHPGKMVCWHRSEVLGDEQPQISASDYKLNLAREAVGNYYPEALLIHNAKDILDANFIILPVFLDERDGLAMSIRPFSCSHESRACGFIYTSLKDARKEWPAATEEIVRDRAELALGGIVNSYNCYLKHDVHSFIIERKERDTDGAWTQVDRSDGYHGSNPDTNGMAQFVDAEAWIEKDLEQDMRTEQGKIDRLARELVSA